MIQPQELRIANYIEYNGEIIKLDGSLLCCYIQNELEFPFNPIPLTEEILLKFGFEIEWLLSDSKGYYVLINNKKIRIKFVHSLQNIYFYIEKKYIDICL